MEEALVSLLLANAGLSALVGTRIRWGLRAQGEALPGVTLFRTDGTDEPTYDGTDELAESHVQADCWGLSYAAAKTVARALKAAAKGRHNTTLKGVFIVSERDTQENVQPDVIYRTIIDLRVLHQA